MNVYYLTINIKYYKIILDTNNIYSKNIPDVIFLRLHEIICYLLLK